MLSVKKDIQDDILLLNQIREGNESVFKHLFETYFTPLCRFVHVYISEKAIVEELVLDIFVYIWENRDKIQIQISLKAYLFQAARNRALNALRQEKRIVPLCEIDQDMLNTDIVSLEEEELYRLIQEAILELPEKCKEIFTLSRNENLSNQEIANKLDISVKTVEAQITKSLKRIKKYLGDSYSYLW